MNKIFLIFTIFLSLSPRSLAYIPTGGYEGYKSPVANFAALPATGNVIGDVRVINSTQDIYAWDGASWQLRSGSGGSGGITSVNGLMGATQLLVTGSAGTDFAISSSGATHTFNIPSASAAARGLLLASDFTQFNGKAPAANPTFTGHLTMPFATENNPSIKWDSDTGLNGISDGETSMTNNAATTQRWHPGSVDFLVPITAPNITLGSQAQGSFFAAPQGSAGAPLFRAIGTAELNSSMMAFPFYIPNSAETDPYLKSDSDTGIAFPSDGLLNTINNNVVTMRFSSGSVDSAVDFSAPNITSGNISATSGQFSGDLTVSTINGATYPQVASGAANTLAAFSSGGSLSSLPYLSYTNGSNIDFIYGNASPALTGDFRILIFDTSGSTTNDYYGLRVNSLTDIGANYTGVDLVSGGVVANQVNMIRAQSPGNIGSDFSGINMFSSGSIGGNFTAANINASGNITGNSYGYNTNNQGAVGGDYFFFGSSNSGSVSGRYGGMQVQNSADVGGNLSFIDVSNGGGHTVGGDVQMFHISSDASVLGSEVLENLHSSSVTSGNKTGIGLQLQGSANNVTGVYVDMNGVTSPNQKAGVTINDGSLSAGYTVDTSVITPSFFGNTHSLGGTLRIASGSPILATPLFGNNLGHQLEFNDNYTADNLIGAGNSLGFSVNGFLNQMIGATGKTVDTVNYMLAAGSNPSGDGHVVNINMFRTAGFINAGGAMTADNMRGFYVDPAFDGSISTTNKWGFINASSSNNWMKGSLVLGGVSGAPTGAYDLDVSGVSSFAGGAQINTVNSQPTCNISRRGLIWINRSSSDSFQICQSVASVYSWVTH